MRSRPLLIALSCLAALGALGLWRLHARSADAQLESGAAAAAAIERSGPGALEAAQDSAAQPESGAPPPRAQAEGTPPAPDAAATELAEARIEGLVVRPDGKPAAQARVWRFAPDLQSEDSTMTDERGRFAFHPAPLGRVQLNATHEDFAPSERFSCELAAGEARRDVRLELREYGRIRGLVLDARGVARAQAAIRCDDWRTRRALFSESDAAGRFEFARVPAGELVVRAKLSDEELRDVRADLPFLANWLANGDQEQEVELAPGQTLEIVLGGIPAGAVRVFGHVRCDGKAEGRTWVWAESRERGPSRSMPRARTDDQGAYELWVATPGPYLFHLGGAAGSTDLLRAVEIRGPHEQALDFELANGCLAGRVVEPGGRPVAGIDVALQSSAPEAEPPRDSYALRNPHCETDAEGRFSFAHLPAGRYELHANPRSKPDAVALYARGQLQGLELAAETQRTGLEIVLRPGCKIRGLVRGPAQMPTAALSVEAFDESSGRSVAGARVDSDGAFLLRGLTEGSYLLRASGAELVSQLSPPVQARSEREAEVELALEPCAYLRVRAKWPAGAQPPALELVVRVRGCTVYETELAPDPDEEAVALLAPGACEVLLSGPGGWQGSELAQLAPGKQTRLEVLLRHVP